MSIPNPILDLELLHEFDEPVDDTLLAETEEVLARLIKKYGFADQNAEDKKEEKSK